MLLKSKWFLLLTALNVSGCYSYLAPSIDFKNASKGEMTTIKNAKVVWNGFHLLESSEFDECGGGSQSHYIDNFFGPVHVEWENAKGKKLSKDFIFEKKDLPSYKKRDKVYTYVKLYFSQSDVFFATSDNPRIKEIEKENACDYEKIKKRQLKEAKIELIKSGSPKVNSLDKEEVEALRKEIKQQNK